MSHKLSNTAFYVDAHFHFDLFKDSESILSEIDRYKIHTIAVTNAPSVFHYTLKASQSRPNLLPAVGLHPELVASHGKEIEAMWPLLDLTRFVGEIGLDYVINEPANKLAQRQLFSRILDRCANYGDKILSVHSRRSAADVITSIGNRFPGCVVLHWFSGSKRELERALEYGFYFSIGPAMLRSKNGLELISSIPKSRVLTESDGPFVRINGEPARPLNVIDVVRDLSQLWKLKLEETQACICDNYRLILSSGSSLTRN